MKDEAIEICSFSKLTLKSEKLVYFSFFLSGSEACVCVKLRTEQGRLIGTCARVGTFANICYKLYLFETVPKITKNARLDYVRSM